MNKKEISISTKGFGHTVDLTAEAVRFVDETGVREGHLNIFAPGSTAGITTIEYEAGVLEDLKAAVERMAPMDIPYSHDARWGDGNGFSHVRAALLGPSLTVPVTGGRPMLGTWQQIVLVDFDNRSRDRRVILTI